MNIVTLLSISLFLLLGIMFSIGKWSFLIAGYNTMSKKEKENYNELSLCKFVGKLMFTVAFSIFVTSLSEVLKINALFYIGQIILIGSIIFGVIYLNTGNRFKKK